MNREGRSGVLVHRFARLLFLAPSLPLVSCEPPLPPRAIEEVPIGTEVSPPPSPDAGPSDTVSSAPVADPEAPPEQPPQDAPPPGKRGRSGSRGTRPVPMLSTGGGDSADGGLSPLDAERARLEAIVFSGKARPADFRALIRVCQKQHDKDCLKALQGH